MEEKKHKFDLRNRLAVRSASNPPNQQDDRFHDDEIWNETKSMSTDKVRETTHPPEVQKKSRKNIQKESLQRRISRHPAGNSAISASSSPSSSPPRSPLHSPVPPRASRTSKRDRHKSTDNTPALISPDDFSQAKLSIHLRSGSKNNNQKNLSTELDDSGPLPSLTGTASPLNSSSDPSSIQHRTPSAPSISTILPFLTSIQANRGDDSPFSSSGLRNDDQQHLPRYFRPLRRRHSWTGWDEPQIAPFTIQKHYRPPRKKIDEDKDEEEERKERTEIKFNNNKSFDLEEVKTSYLTPTVIPNSKTDKPKRKKAIFSPRSSGSSLFSPRMHSLNDNLPSVKLNSPPPRSGIRMAVVVDQRKRISDEKLLTFWGSSALCMGKPVPLSKSKGFWKRLGQFVDTTLPLEDRLFDFIFHQCDEKSLGKLKYEQFRVFLVFYSLKMRITLFKDDVITSAFPRSVELLENTLNYIEMSFDPTYDGDMLNKLWTRSFPDSEIPPIPSERWKEIGFQNSDPQTDFRGAGRFGLECLLRLTKHTDFFSNLRNIFSTFDIPFVISSMNALGLILDFLGWGYKNPKVPYGQYPKTYKTLIDLLFPKSTDNSFDKTRSNLIRLYFLSVGCLAESIQENKTTYLEFPKALESSADRVEELVLTATKDEFTLSKYLVERYGLDPACLLNDNFQIWLPDNNFKSIPYQGHTNLGKILQNLIVARGLVDYIAYDIDGSKLLNWNVKLMDLPSRVIYFLPKESPPGVGTVARHPCFKEKYKVNLAGRTTSGSDTTSNVPNDNPNGVANDNPNGVTIDNLIDNPNGATMDNPNGIALDTPNGVATDGGTSNGGGGTSVLMTQQTPSHDSVSLNYSNLTPININNLTRSPSNASLTPPSLNDSSNNSPEPTRNSLQAHSMDPHLIKMNAKQKSRRQRAQSVALPKFTKKRSESEG